MASSPSRKELEDLWREASSQDLASAIDHPEDVSVYPDEGMTVPPKPFRLFAVRDPRVPIATDHRGEDVTARVATTTRSRARSALG